MSTHYSKGQTMNQLVDAATVLSERVHNEYLKTNKIPLFVYSGMSGIASATAIALYYYQCYDYQVEMIYVRKENEKSHGSSIEISNRELLRSSDIQPYFVDEMICGGDTLKYCISKTSHIVDWSTGKNLLTGSIRCDILHEEECKIYFDKYSGV